MVWLASNQAQQDALEELEQTASDRAFAIVGTAYLETDLLNALEARLRPDEAEVRGFFGTNGPMSNFGARIQLGYLLGIYNAEIKRDLTAIAKIRNKFAHVSIPISFSTSEIRDRVHSLKVVEMNPYPRIPGLGLDEDLRSPPRIDQNATTKARFRLALQLLVILMWQNSHDLIVKSPMRWEAKG